MYEFLTCCLGNKRKRAYDIGQKAIDKELDLVNFIRLQKVTRIMMGAIFSKHEIRLIKNNKRFTVPTKRELVFVSNSDNSDSEEGRHGDGNISEVQPLG